MGLRSKQGGHVGRAGTGWSSAGGRTGPKKLAGKQRPAQNKLALNTTATATSPEPAHGKAMHGQLTCMHEVGSGVGFITSTREVKQRMHASCSLDKAWAT